MTQAMRRLAISFVLLLASLPAARGEQPAPSAVTATNTKPVVVFAAASLKNVLDAISTAWTTKTGTKVSLSYAASSVIAKQIESGAPADVFLSADLKWMDWLAERKLIDAGSRKSLLGNTLVLIGPADSAPNITIAKGFALAEALGDGRLAMGEPKSVPAGAYGKEALTSLGVWDTVASKVAGAENVRVALAYVARGEAPLGIVYATDARSEPKVKVIGTFPADSHAPIVYPVALTASSTNGAARAFLDYLSSPEAAAVFEAQGFDVLK